MNNARVFPPTLAEAGMLTQQAQNISTALRIEATSLIHIELELDRKPPVVVLVRTLSAAEVTALRACL